MDTRYINDYVIVIFITKSVSFTYCKFDNVAKQQSFELAKFVENSKRMVELRQRRARSQTRV